jgi:hypothetical protein
LTVWLARWKPPSSDTKVVTGVSEWDILESAREKHARDWFILGMQDKRID